MSRRSITILATLAVVMLGVLFYLKESRGPLPDGVITPSRVLPSSAIEKRAGGSSAGAELRQKRGFSEKEYNVLRQRYKPNTPQADGPLSADRLDMLARATKTNTRDQKIWPAFKDVIYGNVAALENRLDTGLNADATIYLDYPYNNNFSLLDFAIKAGQRDIVRELLRHHASVNPFSEVAPDGTPLKVEAPLPVAAADGEDDVVMLLLENGADIEQSRDLQTNNQTALNAAVYAQNVSTVYLLLTHGADINSVLGPDGTIPPLLSPRFTAPRIVALRDLLVEYGAKLTSS